MSPEHTTKEAAVILKLDVSRVKQLCRAGRLGTKNGSRWVITDEQIVEYLHAGPRKAGRPKN